MLFVPYQTTKQSTTQEIRLDILKSLLELGKSLRNKSLSMQKFLYGQLTSDEFIYIEVELDRVNSLIEKCLNCDDDRFEWAMDIRQIIYEYYDCDTYEFNDFLDGLVYASETTHNEYIFEQRKMTPNNC